MSKCVLYEPAVRVPLIVRPAGGLRRAASSTPSSNTRRAGHAPRHRRRPAAPDSEGRRSLGYLRGDGPGSTRRVSVSENWGFAAFETDRHKIVVDEDALSPCQLFDIEEDPNEDDNLLADPASKPIVEELMEAIVRPFFASAPARPHPSLFTG